MSNKTLYVILSLTAIAFFYLYLGGIKWGTPAANRSSQIFSPVDKLKKYIPKMIELREKYYAQREEILKERGKIERKQVEETMEKTWRHSAKTPVMGVVSKDVLLDAMRSYFISPNLSDETHAIYPLASMNLKKLDFDPKYYFYGGLYFYINGAALMTGKIMRIVSLEKNIMHYFLNPLETANVYAIVRGASVFFACISAILVFFIARRFFDSTLSAIFSVIFFTLSPLLFLMTHLSKPHVISMFFLTCGLVAIQNDFLRDKRNSILPGIFLGMSASCLITNAFLIVFLIVADFLRKKINWYSYAAFICTWLAFNYFILIHPERFLRHSMVLNIYSNYANFNIIESLTFVWRTLTWGNHFITIPLLLAGIYSMLIQKKPFNTFLVISGLSFLLYNSILLRHQGVWSVGTPFIATYLASGVEFFLKWKKAKPVAVIYIAVVLYILSAKILFYRQYLFTETGNMTLAGDWINKNIKPNVSIGIKDGWPIPGNVPAFNFLNYKIVNIPYDKDENIWTKKNIPDFVVALYKEIDSISSFNKKYILIKEWHQNTKYLGVPFETGWVPTENQNIRIYKRSKI